MENGTAANLNFIFTPDSFLPDIPAQAEAEQKKDGEQMESAQAAQWTVRGGIPALYRLGLQGGQEDLTASGAFLYQVSKAFFRKLTDLPELELAREKAEVILDQQTAEELLRAVPFVIGSEYVTVKWLEGVFRKLQAVFAEEIASYDGTVAIYMTELNQDLHVPERVFFHLVENKEDTQGYPFAFLATYATKDGAGKVRHMPLKYALTEYKNDRSRLLSLLSCLNRAAEVSDLIAGFMESGELFHTLRLTADEAYAFLRQTEAIEAAGILCRIPNWWKRHASTVAMSVKMGDDRPSMLGFDTLISMKPSLTVDGIPLTQKDIEDLLNQTEGLAMLKGRWVEVDHARLKKLLEEIDEHAGEISLMDALRIQMGTKKQEADVGPLVTNGKWLSELLGNLRQPQRIRKLKTPSTLHAELRPYQKNGYVWLNYMDKLGFGACLADDMGLGKTVQVLAYLERMRKTRKSARVLLVVPASLLNNWQKEREKFVPAMPCMVLHGQPAGILSEMAEKSEAFLNITTYGMVPRIKALKNINWDCIILDEAQAIKNPGTAQTRNIKKLQGRMRIAMTGTPIENELTNLWSLFDFLNTGLLGSPTEFRQFCKKLKTQPEQYARLKAMVSPFMLRRLKTDKKIISDLPDKLETIDYTDMTKKQIVLYRKVVSDMEYRIRESDGMERRGLVLATITKLKQICNHPNQYLGQDRYAAEESGKFAMLREICETIYEKRERVIVFTQYREITDYLAGFLKEIFHAGGYVLHGGTSVSARGRIVEAFQGEQYVPFIVLSVKAGGTGLNLTKANHVIHFDRWWNPAVENQATDRAFRIGQTKNVMVHKLVSRGTIEEKIDAMIESKKELADKVIGAGGEKWITELGNDELMSLFRLDL